MRDLLLDGSGQVNRPDPVRARPGARHGIVDRKHDPVLAEGRERERQQFVAEEGAGRDPEVVVEIPLHGFVQPVSGDAVEVLPDAPVPEGKSLSHVPDDDLQPGEAVERAAHDQAQAMERDLLVPAIPEHRTVCDRRPTGARVPRVAGRGLPAGVEEKGVEPALGSRPCVDVKARGVLRGGVVPGGCRLGTLFEAEDVAGSGGRGDGRLQSGIGEMRSARASIAPARLSEATRLPRTVRPPLLTATRGASGRAGGSSRTSAPRGSSPWSSAGQLVGRPDSGEPR